MTATPSTSAPPPFQPLPGNPRFPLFDGLRAGAAVGVLLGHIAALWGVAGSFLGEVVADLQMGVTVFFVISGFLLYRPFVWADVSGREAPSPGVFYLRRILRIVPGYWFALTLLGLLPGVVGIFGEEGWWRYYLLIQNYSGVDFVFAAGIGPAWTLSIEVAFYLVLPLFAIAMRRTGGNDPWRRLVRDLVVLAVLAVASLVTRALFVDELAGSNGDFNPLIGDLILTLPLYFAWFAFGMAFASLSAWSARTGERPAWLQAASSRPNLAWLFACALYVSMVLTTIPMTEGEAVAHHVLNVVIAAAIVFPAAFPAADGRGLPARVLAVPVVIWLGVISYGIYLWGTQVSYSLIDLGVLDGDTPFVIAMAIALAATIAAGAFSYYVVERPFLRLKNRRRRAGPQATSRSRPVSTS